MPQETHAEGSAGDDAPPSAQAFNPRDPQWGLSPTVALHLKRLQVTTVEQVLCLTAADFEGARRIGKRKIQAFLDFQRALRAQRLQTKTRSAGEKVSLAAIELPAHLSPTMPLTPAHLAFAPPCVRTLLNRLQIKTLGDLCAVSLEALLALKGVGKQKVLLFDSFRTKCLEAPEMDPPAIPEVAWGALTMAEAASTVLDALLKGFTTERQRGIRRDLLTLRILAWDDPWGTTATLREICAPYGLSVERVRQLEKVMNTRLADFLEREGRALGEAVVRILVEANGGPMDSATMTLALQAVFPWVTEGWVPRLVRFAQKRDAKIGRIAWEGTFYYFRALPSIYPRLWSVFQKMLTTSSPRQLGQWFREQPDLAQKIVACMTWFPALHSRMEAILKRLEQARQAEDHPSVILQRAFEKAHKPLSVEDAVAWGRAHYPTVSEEALRAAVPSWLGSRKPMIMGQSTPWQHTFMLREKVPEVSQTTIDAWVEFLREHMLRTKIPCMSVHGAFERLPEHLRPANVYLFYSHLKRQAQGLLGFPDFLRVALATTGPYPSFDEMCARHFRTVFALADREPISREAALEVWTRDLGRNPADFSAKLSTLGLTRLRALGYAEGYTFTEFVETFPRQ